MAAVTVLVQAVMAALTAVAQAVTLAPAAAQAAMIDQRPPPTPTDPVMGECAQCCLLSCISCSHGPFVLVKPFASSARDAERVQDPYYPSSNSAQSYASPRPAGAGGAGDYASASARTAGGSADYGRPRTAPTSYAGYGGAASTTRDSGAVDRCW